MLETGIISLVAIILWLVWVVVAMQRKSRREEKMSENKNALQN